MRLCVEINFLQVPPSVPNVELNVQKYMQVTRKTGDSSHTLACSVELRVSFSLLNRILRKHTQSMLSDSCIGYKVKWLKYRKCQICHYASHVCSIIQSLCSHIILLMMHYLHRVSISNIRTNEATQETKSGFSSN